MEELRRERKGMKPNNKDAQRHTPISRDGVIRWPPYETAVDQGGCANLDNSAAMLGPASGTGAGS